MPHDDDELLAQQRDISGERVRVCERCGRGLPSTAAFEPPTGDAVDALLLCPTCRGDIERGLVDLALESDDEE